MTRTGLALRANRPRKESKERSQREARSRHTRRRASEALAEGSTPKERRTAGAWVDRDERLEHIGLQDGHVFTELHRRRAWAAKRGGGEVRA